jgi:hypothetical protein
VLLQHRRKCFSDARVHSDVQSPPAAARHYRHLDVRAQPATITGRICPRELRNLPSIQLRIEQKGELQTVNCGRVARSSDRPK